MGQEAYGEFFVVDHKIRSASDDTILHNIPAASIYEVVKIQQGKPVFFEEHMKRFEKSAALSGAKIGKPVTEILDEIKWLIEKNRCDHVNVKILSMHTAGLDTFVTHFIPLEFPEQDPITEGVRTILFPGERICPNVKTLGGSFRDRVRNARRDSKAFEALLTDENDYITEGSRSNVFFLAKSGVLHTPSTDRVLAGVTRAKVVEICEKFRIPVEKKLVHKRELAGLAGAFITGTTVDVSPVGYIDEIRLGSAESPLIKKIVGAYEKKVEEYISASSF